MDSDAIYRVGMLAVMGVGWVSGTISFSVAHHLGRKPNHEEWIPTIVLLPVLAGLVWPIIVFTPLIGLGYLVHKGIGRVVSALNGPKPTLTL